MKILIVTPLIIPTSDLKLGELWLIELNNRVVWSSNTSFIWKCFTLMNYPFFRPKNSCYPRTPNLKNPKINRIRPILWTMISRSHFPAFKDRREGGGIDWLRCWWIWSPWQTCSPSPRTGMGPLGSQTTDHALLSEIWGTFLLVMRCPKHGPSVAPALCPVRPHALGTSSHVLGVCPAGSFLPQELRLSSKQW